MTYNGTSFVFCHANRAINRKHVGRTEMSLSCSGILKAENNFGSRTVTQTGMYSGLENDPNTDYIM